MRLKTVILVSSALMFWCAVVLTCYLYFWLFADEGQRFFLFKLFDFGLGRRNDALPMALRYSGLSLGYELHRKELLAQQARIISRLRSSDTSTDTSTIGPVQLDPIGRGLVRGEFRIWPRDAQSFNKRVRPGSLDSFRAVLSNSSVRVPCRIVLERLHRQPRNSNFSHRGHYEMNSAPTATYVASFVAPVGSYTLTVYLDYANGDELVEDNSIRELIVRGGYSSWARWLLHRVCGERPAIHSPSFGLCERLHHLEANFLWVAAHCRLVHRQVRGSPRLLEIVEHHHVNHTELAQRPPCCRNHADSTSPHLHWTGASGSGWWYGERWEPARCRVSRFLPVPQSARHGRSPSIAHCLAGEFAGKLILLVGDSNTRWSWYALQRGLRLHPAFGVACFERVNGARMRDRGYGHALGGSRSVNVAAKLISAALRRGRVPSPRCLALFDRWLVPTGSCVGHAPVIGQIEADISDVQVAECILSAQPAAILIGLRLQFLWTFNPGWLRKIDQELAAVQTLVRQLDPRLTAAVVQTNTALHLERRFMSHMGITDPRARAMAERMMTTLASSDIAPNLAGAVDAYTPSSARADLAYDSVHFGTQYSLNAIELAISLMCRCVSVSESESEHQQDSHM